MQIIKKAAKRTSRAPSPLSGSAVMRRLSHMEDLLVEMRGVLDIHLKRIGALQRQIDSLIERDRAEESEEKKPDGAGLTA